MVGVQPSRKAGFSTFASLRPPWCVLAGAPGTHSVCVCVYHQNLKLMLHAVGYREGYTRLLELMVCNTHNEECMLGMCTRCPGVHNVAEYIEEQDLLHSDLWDTVTFQQWVTRNRISLQTCVMPAEEFGEQIIHQLQQMKTHHFISKEQSRYLCDLKDQLSPAEAVAILDFAENYSFIVQDAPHAYHWENRQATIHPIVVYYRTTVTEDVRHQAYAMISDSLSHDTAAVHLYIKVF